MPFLYKAYQVHVGSPCKLFPLLFSGSIPQQQTTMHQQQQQQFVPSSHMSNGRGNEPEEMSTQHDGYDHYSRGRVPSAGPDRSYHNQYDPRERESPNVSYSL